MFARSALAPSSSVRSSSWFCRVAAVVAALAGAAPVPAQVQSAATAAPRAAAARLPIELQFADHKSRAMHWNLHPIQTLAFSPDGTKIFVNNQPGARFAMLDISTFAPTLEIPVGPGLVSMARRPATSEVWLTDRVTSSITVVDFIAERVVATIRVGAEPHGLVFTPSGDRCYVACSEANRVDVIHPSTRLLIKSIPIPAKNPRAIVLHDNVVWVASFMSGNGTAPLGASATLPGVDNIRAIGKPSASAGENPLPDRDVFAIPVQPNPANDVLDPNKTVTGVGTILFNVHVRPGTDELWIPNTEALNTIKGEVNFVGGQVVSNRVTIVDATGINPPQIVDLDALAPAGVGCAQPTAVVFDPVRPRAYVIGHNSDAVAVLDISGPTPTWLGSVELPGKQVYPKFTGPRNAIVNASGSALLVFNKGDSSISRVELANLPTTFPFAVTASVPYSIGFDPVAGEERQGRNHFFNARNSKSLTSSCASCHVDGHTDGVVWDLSRFLDPEGTPNTQLGHPIDNKGPLFTQSVRHLEDSGPYHWRGERRTLVSFNPAFVNLLEREENGVPEDLGVDFRYPVFYMSHLAHPANPRQNVDRSLTQQQARGFRLFHDKPVLGNATCATCHVPPIGTAGEITKSHVAGPFTEADVPQLRGLADRLTPPFQIGGKYGTRTELGAGLSHGGAYPTIQSLLLAPSPTQPSQQALDLSPSEADDLAAYLSAFDTGLAPSTAYQATANTQNLSTFESTHLAFLLDQAKRGWCDVVYRAGPTTFMSQKVFPSGVYDPTTGAFRIAQEQAPQVSVQALMAMVAQGQPVTFLGVPVMMGRPMALDRDMDGIFDLDEIVVGTDPENLDSDYDDIPDGYELDWGLDPLVQTAAGSASDSQAPSLVGAPRVVFATTNSIRFEFDTDEVARVLVSYNGGAPVLRLPAQIEYDTAFSTVLNDLAPASNYTVAFELTDPNGNTRTETHVLSTRPRAFADPVFVESIALALVPSGPGTDLHVDVQLRVGQVAPAPGYVAIGDLYFVDATGGLSTIAPQVQSAPSSATGVATFDLPLPATGAGNPGTLYLVVQDVLEPIGQATYVGALDQEGFDTIAW